MAECKQVNTMKNDPKIPAWMKSTRPDTIFKNCLNVQEGIVEACDFDPAMCQECESTTCKWHPSKLAKGASVEDMDEEDDDDEDDDETDEESDHESSSRSDRDDDDRE